MEAKQQIGFRIPKDLIRRIKHAAADASCTAGEIVVLGMEKFFADLAYDAKENAWADAEFAKRTERKLEGAAK